MDLNSLDFIFIFFPLFLILYLFGASTYRKLLFLAASVLYYFLFQAENLALILGLIAVNFLVVRMISKPDQPPRRKRRCSG